MCLCMAMAITLSTISIMTITTITTITQAMNTVTFINNHHPRYHCYVIAARWLNMSMMLPRQMQSTIYSYMLSSKQSHEWCKALIHTCIYQVELSGVCMLCVCLFLFCSNLIPIHAPSQRWALYCNHTQKQRWLYPIIMALTQPQQQSSQN